MQVKDYLGRVIELRLPKIFAGKNLLVLPSLIDPHVHFRTPGAEHKENWITGAVAAMAGGVTTVLDMPNNNPAVIDEKTLELKKKIIGQQIEQTGLPLHYGLYFGATPDNYQVLEQVKEKIVGVKIFMGSSTGNLLVNKKEDQTKIFAEAARLDLLIAVHAEDNEIINNEKRIINNPTTADHSRVRSRAAAIKAVTQAIELAEIYGAKLYICHISTAEEAELVKEAKQRGSKVYAEVTPHHLFLNESAYAELGTKAQMNPPLRTPADQAALWQAIQEGTIDTIGTDHAPHTLEEKNQPYPSSPSGMPGIETNLPLLLNAYNQGKISLKRMVELTRLNAEKIFNLTNDDWTVVDLDLVKEVRLENLKTKCQWSAWEGIKLKGWPVAVVTKNKTLII